MFNLFAPMNWTNYSGAQPPADTYVEEDGVTEYVTEDGTQPYVPENV